MSTSPFVGAGGKLKNIVDFIPPKGRKCSDVWLYDFLIINIDIMILTLVILILAKMTSITSLHVLHLPTL